MCFMFLTHAKCRMMKFGPITVVLPMKSISLGCTTRMVTTKLYYAVLYTFFFIRTPNFPPSLDVLIFSAISASDVIINVLNYLNIKTRYLFSTTVYLTLNTPDISRSYNMKWSWRECNRILYWPWRILTQMQKKNFCLKWSGYVLIDVLFFSGISAWMFL